MKILGVGLIVAVLLASALAMPPRWPNPNHREEETTWPTQVPKKYASHIQEEMRSMQDVLGSWNANAQEVVQCYTSFPACAGESVGALFPEDCCYGKRGKSFRIGGTCIPCW